MTTPGVPPFHVHPGHLFEGFELVESESETPTQVGRETDVYRRFHVPPSPLLLARCSCGEVLDTAQARFARCPACGGSDTACARCGGTGRVIDHAALEWTAP